MKRKPSFKVTTINQLSKDEIVQIFKVYQKATNLSQRQSDPQPLSKEAFAAPVDSFRGQEEKEQQKSLPQGGFGIE